MSSGKLAVITGASSGIGLELARIAAGQGFDLIVAAKEPDIDKAAIELRRLGVLVDAMQVDLSDLAGVRDFVRFVQDHGQPVDVLIANAGIDRGHAFLDQELDQALAIIDTNIRGTIALLHILGRDMRRQGSGRILITGSIVSFIPGPFHAAYSASKAFLYSFAMALRGELADSGVSVTCLMPGATDTPIYEKAGMLDTAVGQAHKADPVPVAKAGFEAMMRGEREVVPGIMNKLLAAAANIVPSAVLTAVHAAAAKPHDKDPAR
jgi:short-subunit dehydrogenase